MFPWRPPPDAPTYALPATKALNKAGYGAHLRPLLGPEQLRVAESLPSQVRGAHERRARANDQSLRAKPRATPSTLGQKDARLLGTEMSHCGKIRPPSYASSDLRRIATPSRAASRDVTRAAWSSTIVTIQM